ncbi:MAG: WecB/TagA/CpsF family glycosyltransferase [Pseudomonadota bacterium]
MTTSSDRTIETLFGIPFDQLDGAEVAARIGEAARSRTPLWVSTANLDWVMTAKQDARFGEMLRQSDLVTCDGMPVMALATLRGRPFKARVTGVEIFRRLRAGEGGPLRIGFFGAEGDESERASQALNDDPSTPLIGAGGYNPGHGSAQALSAPEHLEAVRAMNADFLVIALTAGKGQEWIAANHERLGVPVMAHLGAVIRQVAGDTEEAPSLMARMGFEWVYRAINEPRLRARYAKNFVALPGLVASALKERVNG